MIRNPITNPEDKMARSRTPKQKATARKGDSPARAAQEAPKKGRKGTRPSTYTKSQLALIREQILLEEATHGPPGDFRVSEIVTVVELCRMYARWAMRKTRGDISLAAKLVDRSEKTFYNWFEAAVKPAPSGKVAEAKTTRTTRSR